jgi:hypothetical protein
MSTRGRMRAVDAEELADVIIDVIKDAVAPLSERLDTAARARELMQQQIAALEQRVLELEADRAVVPDAEPR